ncbi:MAG: hypothetical protein IJ083_00480 [Clostridia bacterium]|nr:hypothetical protein [Clostridia bacterium]
MKKTMHQILNTMLALALVLMCLTGAALAETEVVAYQNWVYTDADGAVITDDVLQTLKTLIADSTVFEGSEVEPLMRLATLHQEGYGLHSCYLCRVTGADGEISLCEVYVCETDEGNVYLNVSSGVTLMPVNEHRG